MKKEKIIVMATVFLDVMGVGIIIPVLPFYVKSFGLGDSVVMLLFSVFSLFAFFSAPILGTLSDRIGRRPVLIASLASTAIGWITFALARAPWMLFLGRSIDGAAAGNFSTAQSYLSDLAKNEKERTENLGLIGAIFGAGLVIGPFMGGILSAIDHRLPFWTVGILASINFAAAIRFLPETLKKKNNGRISLNPFKPITQAINDKILLPRYIVWFLLSVAFACMQSVFALYLLRRFGFNEQVSGYLFSMMGILMIINQTILLKKFWLIQFSERRLEVWLFLPFALGFFLMSTRYFWIFVPGLALLMLAQSVLRVVLSSRAVGIAGTKKQGEVLGVMASMMSLGMIAGPLIAGVLFIQSIKFPFIFASLILLTAFVIMKLCEKRCPEASVEVATPEAL
jgi:multidrug resistance protein